MKTLIVYYSQSGNTRCAAQLLADRMRGKEVDVDLIEIEAGEVAGPLKPDYAAWRELGFPIKNAGVDLGKYDLVVTGAPVWYGRPAPFIKTFLAKATSAEGSKAAYFITGVTQPNRQSRAIKAFGGDLEKSGLRTLDCSLALKMKNGQILLGQQDIDGFVEAILSG